MKANRSTMILSHWTRVLATLAAALISFLAVSVSAQAGPGSPGSPVLPGGGAGPGACTANAGARELDFWLGEWSIARPGAASGDAASTVSLDLEKCLIVESWRGGKNHIGKNIFGFSQEDKTWHGMFADNEGRVHLFEGKVAGGSAAFNGASRGRNGEAELHRITISRLAPDKIEQVWEKSTDNGATWAKVFDGVYSRRKE